MNKPIRCTTHFHACDCREYGFQLINDENENLKVWIKHHQASAQNAVNEKSELMKKMKEKDAEIERIKKENQEMREALKWALDECDIFMSEYPEEYGCIFAKVGNLYKKFNLSETPNSSKEGV